MQISQGTGTVMDQFPSLILCHLPNQLTDVALLAIGQDQVGAVLACGKEQRAQQILMVRVHHQCKLMGQHLVAVITGIACRVIYLQGQGNARLGVSHFPHLRKSSLS